MYLVGDLISEYFKVLLIWNDGKMIDVVKELFFFLGWIDFLIVKDVYLVCGCVFCIICEEINLNVIRYFW